MLFTDLQLIACSSYITTIRISTIEKLFPATAML